VVVECILNILGCNIAALKRHPTSIKVLNGLLQKYPVLGWRTIIKLGKERLLSAQVAEEVKSSIKRFEDREVRRAIW
jgi:hypothetical protein